MHAIGNQLSKNEIPFFVGTALLSHILPTFVNRAGVYFFPMASDRFFLYPGTGKMCQYPTRTPVPLSSSSYRPAYAPTNPENRYIYCTYRTRSFYGPAARSFLCPHFALRSFLPESRRTNEKRHRCSPQCLDDRFIVFGLKRRVGAFSLLWRDLGD